MKDLKRIPANKITVKMVGDEFVVAGYIESIRDHGELVFMDVINNGVLIQIVFDPAVCNIEGIKHLRAHSTIKCSGKLEMRSLDRVNKKIQTGEVELRVSEYEIISEASAMPIDETTTNELKLLEFRNVYLRQQSMQLNIKTKARLISAMRSHLDTNDFYDIETPVLTRTTPGGAKDFLSLSSAVPANVYGLAQSPQMFKQLLMTTGLERYYQLAKCFRDETLRSDRQPEFLQLDLEISWADMPEIMSVVEGMVKAGAIETGAFAVNYVFPRMTYKEAMDRFGSDKPDLRFGVELKEVTDILKNTTFKPFAEVIKSGGVIKSIAIPSALYSRAERKEIEEKAISLGAKGLGYFLIEDGVINSPLTKFLKEEDVSAIITRASIENGDPQNQIIYLLADEKDLVNKVLGQLRLKFGKDMGLIKKGHNAFLWVIDFPLFEKKDNGQIGSAHHPFTAPDKEDYDLFKRGKLDIFEIKSKSYDLVLNGSEIGGGSVRIHNETLQGEIFELLKLEKTERESLNWFLELFKFGVPEHAGFALGVDRFVMEVMGLSSIRETVAFPKNSFGACQMTQAPSEIPTILWKEYGLKKI